MASRRKGRQTRGVANDPQLPDMHRTTINVSHDPDLRTDEPLPGPDWLLHWRRVRHLREEIGYAYAGVDDDGSPVRTLGLPMVYAFFVLCHHVADWLHHGAGIRQRELDDLVERNRELQICRDLCLGTKHAVVRNQKRVTESARICKESSTITHDKPTRYSWTISFVDRASGEVEFMDVNTLATKCFFIWQDYLLERDMLRR
jgi:hypothetical protein